MPKTGHLEQKRQSQVFKWHVVCILHLGLFEDKTSFVEQFVGPSWMPSQVRPGNRIKRKTRSFSGRSVAARDFPFYGQRRCLVVRHGCILAHRICRKPHIRYAWRMLLKSHAIRVTESMSLKVYRARPTFSGKGLPHLSFTESPGTLSKGPEFGKKQSCRHGSTIQTMGPRRPSWTKALYMPYILAGCGKLVRLNTIGPV